MCSDTSHWACWVWSLLERAPVQVRVSCLLFHAWGLQVEASKWSIVGCHWHQIWRCLGDATLSAEAGRYLFLSWDPVMGTIVQVETRHHLCQVCGCLVEAVFQANTGYCLCQAWGLLMGVKSASWDPSPLLLGLGCLSRATRYTKVSCCFLGFGDLSDILGKFAAVAKAGYFSVGAAGRGLGWASELGGTGSWNHQGGVNGVSQVKGEHRFGSHLCLAD